MPLSLKHILIIILILSANVGYCRGFADTIKKTKEIRQGLYTTSSVSTSEKFTDGVKAIRSDSLDKGIHLMAESLNNTVYRHNLLYVLNYTITEIFYVIKQLDSAKLSVNDQTAGKLFIKSIFTSPAQSCVKILEPFFKATPNSLFMLRLKVLTYANFGDKRLLPAINELLKKQPDLLAANILQAQYQYDRGNYQQAIKWCDKTISIYSKYTFALQLRAECYLALKDGTKALKDFDEVLRLFPTHAEAAYSRSTILLDSAMYKAAVPGFIRALEVNPRYGYPAYNLARCYKALAIRDSALYFTEKHITRYPEDGAGYDLKGEILADNNDYLSAIDFFYSAIKLNPNNENFYEDRGDAYFNIDSVDFALTDFKKAASLDKKRAYPNDRIGDCYYDKKNYEMALNYYELAMQMDPTYKYVYVDIELIYNKQGKFKEGIDLLKKAIAIDSTYSTAIGSLGWNYYCLGNYDDCIKYSNKALLYEPGASYAMFNIALAILCKGDYEKSKERYAYYLNLCKQKGYNTHVAGATDDLRNLIKANRFKDQATYIIKNIFGETP